MILAAGFTTGPNTVSYNSSAPSKNHLFESIEQFLFRSMHMYDIAHIHDRIAGTVLRKMQPGCYLDRYWPFGRAGVPLTLSPYVHISDSLTTYGNGSSEMEVGLNQGSGAFLERMAMNNAHRGNNSNR
jgi:hypothetical protein